MSHYEAERYQNTSKARVELLQILTVCQLSWALISDQLRAWAQLTNNEQNCNGCHIIWYLLPQAQQQTFCKWYARLAETYGCQNLNAITTWTQWLNVSSLVLGKPCTENCPGRATGWHDRFLDDGPLQCLPCNFKTAGEWYELILQPCSLFST